MQDQDVIEFGLQHQTSQASCVIKGNFAVFAVASSKIITIVDLQERQTGLFDCSVSDSLLEGFAFPGLLVIRLVCQGWPTQPPDLEEMPLLSRQRE